MGWVVKAMPQPLVQEVGWAPGPVWMWVKKLTPTGIRSLDCPHSNELLNWLHYPGPQIQEHVRNISSITSENKPQLLLLMAIRLTLQVTAMWHLQCSLSWWNEVGRVNPCLPQPVTQASSAFHKWWICNSCTSSLWQHCISEGCCAILMSQSCAKLCKLSASILTYRQNSAEFKLWYPAREYLESCINWKLTKTLITFHYSINWQQCNENDN